MCAFSIRLSGSRTRDEGFDKLSAYPLLLQALRRFASDMGRSFHIIDVSHRLGERVTEALSVAGVANEHHITVDEAFRRIRGHSQDNNLKLLAVCRLVVDDGLKIPEGE